MPALMLAIGLCAIPSSANANSKYASIVMDTNNGKILFSRQADAQRYPASLTKMMTLYMLFAELDAGNFTLNSQLRVSKHAAGQPPSKLGLKPGETIRVKDAILALVTKSANDVAVTVAENISGSEALFARAMTHQARLIGMKHTVFRNASGLPDKKQVTTARDMMKLGQTLIRNFPHYYEFFKARSFNFRGITYRTHNKLLASYNGTDGIKTGYTRASGYNLVSSVRRDGKHLIAVVLGGHTAKSRDKEMKRILDKSFSRASVHYASAEAPGNVPIPRSVIRLRGTLVLVSERTTGETQNAIWVKGSNAPVMLDLPPAAPENRAAADRGDDSAIRGQIVEEATAKNWIVSASKTSWSIQIGAFNSAPLARDKLARAQTLAPTVLERSDPYTMSVKKGELTLYRARFGGLSQAAARKACSILQSKQFECVAIAPQNI